MSATYHEDVDHAAGDALFRWDSIPLITPRALAGL